ncbi:AAA family ATPase [Ruegeria atlantica]|uniref:AAA family ATPase n=1 Tax=Ruegeria atlantica TaxID=81569 RepID=UPI00147EDED3|nr:AAA family ATPase [Ruegeria atlantica]
MRQSSLAVLPDTPDAAPDPIRDMDAVRAAVRAELEAYALSQAEAATAVGVSVTTLSRWLVGKYEGDNPKVTAQMARWLETRFEARALSLSPAGLDAHVDLGVTGQVMAALAHAQATGDVVLVHGRSGAGKSWAIKRYAASRSGVHPLVMTCGVTTLGGLYGRVARVLGVAGRYRSALEAEDAILARLEGRQALLAVDEAQHLTPSLLDALRGLRDLSGAGLALVGGQKVCETLARCPQVTGRIGVKVGLRATAPVDIDALVAAVLGRVPDREESRITRAAATGPGGLHALRRLLARAWMIAHADGREIVTGADIAAAGETS